MLEGEPMFYNPYDEAAAIENIMDYSNLKIFFSKIKIIN